MPMMSSLEGTLGLVGVQVSASAASAMAGIALKYSSFVHFPVSSTLCGISISSSMNWIQFTRARTVVMVLKF